MHTSELDGLAHSLRVPIVPGVDTATRPLKQNVLAELRRRMGGRCQTVDESASRTSVDLSLWKAGTIGEFLCDGPGSGAESLAWCGLLSWLSRDGVCVLIDGQTDCCGPAIAVWGIAVSRLLVIQPADTASVWWAVEQCFRSRSVAATCAWADRVSEKMFRRWQLAAEVGGGVGLFFRPLSARREPSGAEFRVLVTPQTSANGETRRVRLEMLYRRGGLGDGMSLVEIDHEAGRVQLVPAVAHSTALHCPRSGRVNRTAAREITS